MVDQSHQGGGQTEPRGEPFLLEIGSEEMPAQTLVPACAHLEALVAKKAGSVLRWEGLETWATPRRLGLRMNQVQALEIPATQRPGPRVELGPDALAAFCKSVQVDPDQCFQKETPQGLVWVAPIPARRPEVEELLTRVCQDIFTGLAWPKRMRWKTGFSWIRPLRTLTALYGTRVLGFTFEGVRASNRSPLHRLGVGVTGATFLPGDLAKRVILGRIEEQSRGFLTICDPSTYDASMDAVGVCLRGPVRAQRIRQALLGQAQSIGAELFPQGLDDLIQENAGLTEWPQVVQGGFDETFLSLPAEVIATALAVHQRAFCLIKSQTGRLINQFLVVTDGLVSAPRVVQGYERVVQARLADALFFWNQDRSRTLAHWATDLAQRGFFQGLGTLADKARRVHALAQWLVTQVEGVNKAQERQENVGLLAQLARADLSTAVVGEFPTLQGVMGRIYALMDGHPSEVAQGIESLYSFARLDVPTLAKTTSGTAAYVAAADAMDTLVGFFGLGRAPTGSKDPMALRRTCHGLLRALLAHGLDVDVSQMAAVALRGYQDQGFLLPAELASLGSVSSTSSSVESLDKALNSDAPGLADKTLAGALDALTQAFAKERLIHVLREDFQLDPALTGAISARGVCPAAALRWAKVLYRVRHEHPGFEAAYHRARALVQAEGGEHDLAWSWTQLQAYDWECDQEKALVACLRDSLPAWGGEENRQGNREENRYHCEALIQWAQAIDAFFEAVLVTHPDHRAARLGLLGAITRHFQWMDCLP